MREEAAYVGQMDNHSIEIKTEFETEWDEIATNTDVVVEFLQNEKQHNIF